MRVLYLGDIMGRSGRTAVVDALPGLRADLKLDFVVANGENAAGGFGITEKISEELFAAGVDCISGGNHTFDQNQVKPYLDKEPRMLRPLNYPAGTSGRGSGLYDAGRGRKILVVNAMGRVFMQPLDNPFHGVDKVLAKHPLGVAANFILVDIHGEATSEKNAMGHYCDGRASLVVGTHSHIPTADARILAGGTAYQTDAGMCGDYDSVIGMTKEEPIHRFLTNLNRERYTPASGEATLCGTFVESDDRTGKAIRVEPLRMGGDLAEHIPAP